MWTKYKGRLIILGVMIVLLAVVAFLLTKRVTNKTVVAGTSFNELYTIYDLRTPLGVTADSDNNVYVSDTGDSRLAVYDQDGNLQYTLDKVQNDADGKTIAFPSPYGLAVDGDKLYVCDYSVHVLDKGGKYLYSLTIPAGVIQADPNEKARLRPNEVCVLGDRVYVTSRDGIYIWDKNTKQFVTHWGTRGNQIGQWDFPNGIAGDPKTGNLFVADTNNYRVVSLTKDGKVRWTLGSQPDAKVASPFRLLRSVAVGPDGMVYVSDDPDRILVLDENGKLVSILGQRGTAETQLNFPEGIFVTDSNRLLVADRENDRVQVWQLNGQLPTPDKADVDKFAKALKTMQP